MLDNGLTGWSGPLDTGRHESPPGDFVAAPPRTAMKLDYDDVRQRSDRLLLLDARRTARYRG
ncbi:MAG: sulfurtransferase, partial [Candidatus Dormibacteria bacterium]